MYVFFSLHWGWVVGIINFFFILMSWEPFNPIMGLFSLREEKKKPRICNSYSKDFIILMQNVLEVLESNM